MPVKLLMMSCPKVIVGQEEIVNNLIVTLLCRGHCLLIGVPGLAKTLMISSLAQVLDLSFSRIQFTPDLMPSDIMGTEVMDEDLTTGPQKFPVRQGTGFLKHRSRRRDQPHTAQNPVCAPRSDAGALSYHTGLRP